MEARNIGIGLSALAIAMFAGFVGYSLQYDSLLAAQLKVKEQVSVARSELEEAESRKTRTSRQLDAVKFSYAQDDQTVRQTNERIEAVEEDLRKKERSLAQATKELAALEKQINDAVEFQRAAAVGSTYPRIALSNGKILLNAKLTRFTPQKLDFTHSAGKSTVRWNALPEEFTYRFHMGGEETADDTVIEDTDDAGDADHQAAAAADAKAAAKAAEQRSLLEGRLRTVRYDLSLVSASIAALSRKSAPNLTELAEFQRKRAALEAVQADLVERLARVQ